MKMDLYEKYQGGGDASEHRKSYQEYDGNDYYLGQGHKHSKNDQHGDQENEIGSGSGGRAEGGFNFGSMEERMFVPQYQQVGRAQVGANEKTFGGAVTSSGLMNQKQLFSDIEINIWIPRDPYILTHDFRLQDVIEDEIEKLEKVQYHCEVMSHTSVEAILFKSIDFFNQQLEEEGRAIRFVQDKQHFHMRIAKKKNGKPNFDYPRVDLVQQIVDIDFQNFCIMYAPEGVINLLNQTMSSNKSKSGKSGIHISSPLNDELNQHTKQDFSKAVSSNASTFEGNLIQAQQLSMNRLSMARTPSADHSSEMHRGGIPSLLSQEDLNTNGSEVRITEASSRQSNAHQMNSSQQACCAGGCSIF